jgi:drug/metabolite transporter (DMT)-like permease
MDPRLLIWISVVLSAVAQILLKQGMLNLRRDTTSNGGVLALFGGVLKQGFVWMWGVLFVLATVLWVLGIERVDLSYAYPLVSFGYVLVSVLAAIFFKEKVRADRWIAIFVICIGVYLIAGS